MKQFAIAINSETEYNKVKEYADKWGYKEYAGHGYQGCERYAYIDTSINDETYNACHMVDDECDKVFKLSDNWRKAIRKHSPLKLENICVRIDTVEHVKEVWDIVKDSGVEVFDLSKTTLIEGSLIGGDFLEYNHKFLVRSGNNQNKTEITPKQLAHILGVKRNNKIPKVFNTFQSKVIDRFNERLNNLEKHIPMSDNVNDYIGNPIKELPKIAIRVENEQEFNDLMKIYDVLGWKWASGDVPTSKRYIMVNGETIISFRNRFVFHDTSNSDSFHIHGYTIIPFSQIKNLV